MCGVWRGVRVTWGVVVFVWWGSAGRGSGWVRNMYDDLLRVAPLFCDIFSEASLPLCDE